MRQTKDAADVALVKAENLGQFLDVPNLPLVDVTLPFATAGNGHTIVGICIENDHPRQFAETAFIVSGGSDFRGSIFQLLFSELR